MPQNLDPEPQLWYMQIRLGATQFDFRCGGQLGGSATQGRILNIQQWGEGYYYDIHAKRENVGDERENVGKILEVT